MYKVPPFPQNIIASNKYKKSTKYSKYNEYNGLSLSLSRFTFMYLHDLLRLWYPMYCVYDMTIPCILCQFCAIIQCCVSPKIWHHRMFSVTDFSVSLPRIWCHASIFCLCHRLDDIPDVRYLTELYSRESTLTAKGIDCWNKLNLEVTQN